MLPIIKKENVSKAIVKSLLEYMITTNKKPGDLLPTEHELVSQFKVSRNSVREGLKTLENIGIIESKTRVGHKLTSGGSESYLLPFLFGFSYGEAGIQSLTETRLIIELSAIRLAITKATERELDDLMKIAVRLDDFRLDTVDNYRQLCDYEIAFHHQVITLSGNPVLQKFGVMWPIYFQHLSRYKKEGTKTQNKVSHGQIVLAMQARNVSQATELLHEHVAFWIDHYKILPTDMLANLK